MIDLTHKPKHDDLVCELFNLMLECDIHAIPFRNVHDTAKALYELYEEKRAWDCGTRKTTDDCAPTVKNPLGKVTESISLKD